MNSKTMNPLDLIKRMMDSENFKIVQEYITYDKSVNEENDLVIDWSSSHDGTLIFTHALIEKILAALVNKRVIENNKFNDEEMDSLKDIKYTIGDLTLKSEYGVKVKSFTGMRDTVFIPVKFEYIF